MARIMALLMGPLILQTYAVPVTFFRQISGSNDPSWPWNGWWAWGAETSVSIVDRSPSVTFGSRAAAFGPQIKDPLLGYVIPLSSFTTKCPQRKLDLNDNLGCPSLCQVGDHYPDRTETWIALVQRGECQFADKVREAQRLGARAVVVGGDDPRISGIPDTLISMYSPDDSSDISIPSTFIRYSDYEELSDLIARSGTSHNGLKTLSLLIITDSTTWQTYSPIITFAILLLLPSILTLLTLLIHRIRASQAARRDRAPEDVVTNLPWQIYTSRGWEKRTGPVDPPANPDEEPTCSDPPVPSEDISTSPETSKQNQFWFDAQVECAICLNDFVPGDRVRVLPCHHIFHVEEVDEWLIHRKKLCPVCKADVTQPLQSESTREPATETTPLLGEE